MFPPIESLSSLLIKLLDLDFSKYLSLLDIFSSDLIRLIIFFVVFCKSNLFLLEDISINSFSSLNRFLSLFSLSFLFLILSSNFCLILSIIISELIFLPLSFSSTKNFKLSSKLIDICSFLLSLRLKYFCIANLYLNAGIQDSFIFDSLNFSIFVCSLSHIFFILSLFFLKDNFLLFSLDLIIYLLFNNLFSLFFISSIIIFISSSPKFK